MNTAASHDDVHWVERLPPLDKDMELMRLVRHPTKPNELVIISTFEQSITLYSSNIATNKYQTIACNNNFQSIFADPILNITLVQAATLKPHYIIVTGTLYTIEK